ncbi:hypothetical protein NXT09_01075 [Pectobacterium sp. 13-115]|nr:hypothetical protein [Pectobacterium jejuense]
MVREQSGQHPYRWPGWVDGGLINPVSNQFSSPFSRFICSLASSSQRSKSSSSSASISLG